MKTGYAAFKAVGEKLKKNESLLPDYDKMNLKKLKEKLETALKFIKENPDHGNLVEAIRRKNLIKDSLYMREAEEIIGAKAEKVVE